MDKDFLIAAAGLGTGLSLIVAIGAQNAFVLRQGLLREHVPVVVAVCALSDLVLITLGVAGLGAVVKARPGLLTTIAWVGAAFLVGYGLFAARRAWRPSGEGEGLDGGGATPAPTGRPVSRSLLTCLGLTWLNPHVYLDTVLLLGSVAAGYGSGRWVFALGAGIGSVLWFAGLGFGARFARPVFARPAAWRVLDAMIALVMIGLGVRLAALG